MKKSLIGAAFLVAAGGAAGVSALDIPTLGEKGSDTLFDLTSQVFLNCPGLATAVYAGSGSGNGQAAMVAGTQQVAPMSRFLNGGAMCGGSTIAADGGKVAPEQGAAGLVIGLDGIEVVGSKNSLGSDAGFLLPDGGPLPDGGSNPPSDAGTLADGAPNAVCNQDRNLQCDPAFETNSGATYNTTISGTVNGAAVTYTFAGWRDVLRVLLGGFDTTNAAAAGTNAAAWAARDCNSPVRQLLANSWGNFFENNCQAWAGDTNGTCTQIRHVFRRDDFSGTTDTIVGLLGMPSIVNPEATGNLVSGGLAGVTTNHTGATPFCNAVRPAYVFPAASQPTCLQGADATWDPTALTPPTGCTRETAVYRATMQDNDPIRRTCVGTGAGTAPAEDMCSHSGDLGLELVMNDVPEPNSVVSNPATTGNGDRYSEIQTGSSLPVSCAVGGFAESPIPDVYSAITQLKVTSRSATGTILCPNGDISDSAGGCKVPVVNNTVAGSVVADPRCAPTKKTTGTSASPLMNNNVPAVNPKLVSQGDGREYAQHLYALNGTSAVYQNNGFATPLAVTGGFFRLHMLHSLNANTGRTCTLADNTDQIGCLVEASPCSLGYAGRGATANSDQNGNTNTAAIKVNAQTPEAICIQGSPNGLPDGGAVPGFAYPLSRKLYLNSTVGFGAVTGQELNLSACETDLAQTISGGTTTPAGLMTNHAYPGGGTGVASFGFLPLPGHVNSGEPYCEDFNEQVICGADGGVNVNGCVTSVPAGFVGSTFANNTVCGNGTKDAFEDCDPGATAGTADNNCPIPGGGQAGCSTSCRCKQ